MRKLSCHLLSDMDVWTSILLLTILLAGLPMWGDIQNATGAGAENERSVGSATLADGRNTIMEFTVRIERGKDVGQNFGSLFEARTADGRFVIGAGFLGLYNTFFRADRHTVQFFIRPTQQDRKFTTERLPRPTRAAGTYLFELDGRVYARGYAYENVIRWWNEDAQKWENDPDTTDGRMRLGNGMLYFSNNRVEYNGRSMLKKPKVGTYHRFYYAHGRLFFYHLYWARKSGYRAYTTDEEGFSKLYACPWLPDSGRAIDISQATVITLPFVGETPFAYGQLGTDVLTCSNIGGLYLFDGRTWRTLVKPEVGTSYQIYSMINFYDRLLMGHYPTGLLYEFDGENVTLLDGWPPRLEGVSRYAREAQTTTIYGGELFVGVWPWAELWRYNCDSKKWISMGRMFTHPEPTDKTTHPYENECRAHNLVLNQWGQRITSFIPFGDALMVSTSAKWPCKWTPALAFLKEEKQKEYGSVIRLKMPGNLAANLRWTDGPTELQFVLCTGEVRILQDGETRGAARLDRALAADIAKSYTLGDIAWGRGIFGRFAGKLLGKSVETKKAQVQ